MTTQRQIQFPSWVRDLLLHLYFVFQLSSLWPNACRQCSVRTRENIKWGNHICELSRAKQYSRLTSPHSFFTVSLNEYLVCPLMVWLEWVFLLEGDTSSRNLSCLAPFLTYHPLPRERKKRIWILKCFDFADGRNQTRAASAASECAINYTIASPLHFTFLIQAIIRLQVHFCFVKLVPH